MFWNHHLLLYSNCTRYIQLIIRFVNILANYDKTCDIKCKVYQAMIIFSNRNEVNNNSQTNLKPANSARSISWSTYPETSRHLRFEKTANISGYHRVEAASNERIIAGQSFELIVRFRYDSVPILWCVAMPLAAPNNMWTSRSWWDRRDYYAPLHHERKACVGQGRRAMWMKGGMRDRDKSRKRPRPRGEREG